MPEWVKRFLPFISLIVLCALIPLAEYFVLGQDPKFLTHGNLAAIARQTAVITIMAMGMTMVMVSGGIDLSVPLYLGNQLGRILGQPQHAALCAERLSRVPPRDAPRHGRRGSTAIAEAHKSYGVVSAGALVSTTALPAGTPADRRDFESDSRMLAVGP